MYSATQHLMNANCSFCKMPLLNGFDAVPSTFGKFEPINSRLMRWRVGNRCRLMLFHRAFVFTQTTALLHAVPLAKLVNANGASAEKLGWREGKEKRVSGISMTQLRGGVGGGGTCISYCCN